MKVGFIFIYDTAVTSKGCKTKNSLATNCEKWTINFLNKQSSLRICILTYVSSISNATCTFTTLLKGQALCLLLIKFVLVHTLTQ